MYGASTVPRWCCHRVCSNRPANDLILLLPVSGPAFLSCCMQCARTIFHSAGREDADVRMLGNGRPVVLELVDCRRRPSEEICAVRVLLRALPLSSRLFARVWIVCQVKPGEASLTVPRSMVRLCVAIVGGGRRSRLSSTGQLTWLQYGKLRRRRRWADAPAPHVVTIC